MRTCEACGGSNDDAATRCSRCGASLAPAPPAPVAAPAAGPPEPSTGTAPTGTAPTGTGAAGGAGVPGSEPPARARPAVVARLSPATLEVEPGGVVEAVLEIRNTAAAADRVTVEVIGDAAPWTEVDPPVLDVAAAASAVAAVRVRPPRDTGAAGTSVDVGFVVRSSDRPDTAAVELAVVQIRASTAPAVAATAWPAGAAAPPDGAAAPGATATDAGPAPAVAPAAAPRRSAPHARGLAGVGLLVVAVVAVAGAALLGRTVLAPADTPAAVATPSALPASPDTTRTPEPTATSSPTPTPAPPTPTPGPDAPAAWWQDAWDAAAVGGAVLGAFVAEGTTDDGLPFATFADGAIYQRVTDAFSMSGAIWRAWVERGGGASPAPGLGFPAGPALGLDPGHRRQLFDDGAIYWTEATGAHAVHGEVWAWWRQLVRDRGGDVEQPGDSGLVEPLGYPVGDVRADASGTWIDLEAGRIGVRTDGTRWACSTATPPAGFLACAVVDPRP